MFMLMSIIFPYHYKHINIFHLRFYAYVQRSIQIIYLYCTLSHIYEVYNQFQKSNLTQFSTLHLKILAFMSRKFNFSFGAFNIPTKNLFFSFSTNKREIFQSINFNKSFTYRGSNSIYILYEFSVKCFGKNNNKKNK